MRFVPELAGLAREASLNDLHQLEPAAEGDAGGLVVLRYGAFGHRPGRVEVDDYQDAAHGSMISEPRQWRNGVGTLNFGAPNPYTLPPCR